MAAAPANHVELAMNFYEQTFPRELHVLSSSPRASSDRLGNHGKPGPCAKVHLPRELWARLANPAAVEEPAGKRYEIHISACSRILTPLSPSLFLPFSFALTQLTVKS